MKYIKGKNEFVQIKGASYKIQLVDNLYGNLGMTDTKNKVIYIEKEKDKNELEKTILHELLHANLYECGLPIWCNDENLISWLENNFLDIFDQFLKISYEFEEIK